MPSPFPGMDPYLESQDWEDFHTRWNTALADAIGPQLGPNYIVRMERRMYVERPERQDWSTRRADVAILHGTLPEPSGEPHESSAGTAVQPVECELPMSEERRETYLIVRERPDLKIVSVIETLSPANKRRGGDGQREYLTKRQELLDSSVHLVELDLLCGGDRLPVVGKLPLGDYYAFVSRGNRRPTAEVYAWTIRQSLPSIPLPLHSQDPDVSLPLQAVFQDVYDRARYQLSLDYQRPLAPAFSDADGIWCRGLLS